MKYLLMVLFFLLLNGLFLVPFTIESARADYAWTETIYIRADGRVEPVSAPISSGDNATYLLSDNIVGNIPGYSSAIRVERDNITIDGNGYSLEGSYVSESTGIGLIGREYVTVRNLQVKFFHTGIWLYGSSYTTILGNTLTGNTTMVAESRVILTTTLLVEVM